MEYLEAIQDAIKKGYGFDSIHVKTVPVTLKHDGEIVWDGEVEIFKANAIIIYGWGFEEKGKTEFVTVLEQPPVDGPETAIKFYLANQNKI